MEKSVLVGLAGVILVVLLMVNALINGFVAAWLIAWFVTPHAPWFQPDTYQCAGVLVVFDFARNFGRAVPANWKTAGDTKMTMVTNNFVRPATALCVGYALHWLAQ